MTEHPFSAAEQRATRPGRLLDRGASTTAVPTTAVPVTAATREP